MVTVKEPVQQRLLRLGLVEETNKKMKTIIQRYNLKKHCYCIINGEKTYPGKRSLSDYSGHNLMQAFNAENEVISQNPT